MNMRCRPPAPPHVRSPRAAVAAPSAAAPVVVHAYVITSVCAPMSAVVSAGVTFHCSSSIHELISCTAPRSALHLGTLR